MNKKEKDIVKDFLRNSNNIESEYSEQAFIDSERAWRWAYTNKDKIDLKYILKIHELLARNLRKDIAGKIRNCDVWIGGHCKTFISEALLREELEGWIKEWGDSKTEEEIKNAHIAYEEIHPYIDFNGRSGRLLMNIQRVNAGLPILIIHGWKDGDEEFHSEQASYYKWFN